MNRKRSVKTRSLLEVTGPRPTCQRCGKTLRPWTSYFDVPGHIEAAPTADDLRMNLEVNPNSGNSYDYQKALKFNYSPGTVYRITHNRDYRREESSRVFYWDGSYYGYGWGEGGGKRRGPLLEGARGKLSYRGIQDIVERYGRAARVGKVVGLKDFSHHCMRHTCARRMIEAGVPISDVAAHLGHADVKTTMRYIGSKDEDLSRAAEALDDVA